MAETTNKFAPKTPIPKAVRVAAGKRAAEKNKASDPLYYVKMGSRGGKAPHTTRGFQAMSEEKRRAAGRKGGINKGRNNRLKTNGSNEGG